MECQTDSSVPSAGGSSPSSSQSALVILRNSVNALSGFKSSMALSMCISSCLSSCKASLKLSRHAWKLPLPSTPSLPLASFFPDPHRADLFHDAVDGAAVRAGGAFPAQGRELFREGGDGERVEVRSPEQGEEFPVLRRVEQDPRAGLRAIHNGQYLETVTS